MKEATGEVNLTVVAIILIGVVVAVVTPIINSTMKNTKYQACCNNLGGKYSNNQCVFYENGTQVTKGKDDIVNSSGECIG